MKKGFSSVSIRVVAFIISALVFITGSLSMSYAADIASEEPEEESELIAYEELPEADVADAWQINEENGEDPIRESNSMNLMDTYTYDASFEAEISVFPESYKNALRRIHSMYPNFTFVADNIKMTLDAAVREQIDNGYKTYRSVYTDDYDTIRKFMDPLTYLYPEYDSRYDVYSSSFNHDWHIDADFFVFADHAYSSNQYAAALYYLIEGCDFLENEDMNSIITASAKCNMNPYVMASTVILEKGWSAAANGNADVTGRVVNKGHVSDATVYSSAGGSGVLGTVKNSDVYIVAGGDTQTSDGKTWLKIIFDSDGNLFDSKVRGVPGFVESTKVTDVSYFNTYYNLFSINQTDDNPVVGGIAYAMSHGWTSLASSFEGGAYFCKNYYYDNDQPTYYYMHYNVLNPTSNWWHEYSTGVSAGLKCARILRYGYDYDHDQTLVLRIPVYIQQDSDVNPASMNTGWNKINGVWYYKHSSGTLATGWNKINGAWYYFNNAFVMMTGMQKLSDGTYYLNSDGAMQTGWQKIDGKWYFFYDSGRMATGWLKRGSTWYYMESSGVMATGWRDINGARYYLNPSGAMATGWKQINGVWYFLRDSGAMATGWLKRGDTWYYLNSSGDMAVGWKNVNGTWYFLRDSGAMATGWLKRGNTWYYLNPSGAMATGWKEINGTYYFFKSSGAMAANEWVSGYWWLSSDGGWHYKYRGSWHQDSRGRWFGDEAGYYERDCTVIIDGVSYTFDENGYTK